MAIGKQLVYFVGRDRTISFRRDAEVLHSPEGCSRDILAQT